MASPRKVRGWRLSIAPPSEIVVVRDTREKDGLIFPEQLRWKDDRGNERVSKLVVVDKTMDVGDYGIGGALDISLVDKKGSIQEMRDNIFSADRHRFRRCIDRLVSSCKYPYILVTVPLKGLVDPKYGMQGYEEVVDAMCRWMHRENLRLLWIPYGDSVASRRKVGELVARIMWTHAWESAHENPLGVSESGRPERSKVLPGDSTPSSPGSK